MISNYLIKILSIATLGLLSLNTVAQDKSRQAVIDPVCGKTVDKSESYDWKYGGKVYSFDSYDCRYSFKMNPQKFLTKNCVEDMTAIDPVCGMRVNKSECYDTKFDKIKYHFCSFECRETFKMNPAKFANNKCVVTDSTSVK